MISHSFTWSQSKYISNVFCLMAWKCQPETEMCAEQPKNVCVIDTKS